MTKASEPAFPVLLPTIYPGLTKREYFAARAMQGMLANPHDQEEWSELVKSAAKVADQQLEALAETEKK